jgi:hypothetical protein
LLRNGANILKLTYEPFILNFSILGLIFHSLNKKCLNRLTDGRILNGNNRSSCLRGADDVSGSINGGDETISRTPAEALASTGLRICERAERKTSEKRCHRRVESSKATADERDRRQKAKEMKLPCMAGTSGEQYTGEKMACEKENAIV